MIVVVQNKKINLDKTTVMIGGEAEVYRYSNYAVKIFKNQDHFDYADDENQQVMAQKRLEIHQTKINDLKKKGVYLSKNIILPKELVYKNSKKDWIIGYTMDFIKNSYPLSNLLDINFRKGVITNKVTTDIFLTIYGLIEELHNNKILITDFNDKNCLIDDKYTPFLIDTDSYDFDNYTSYLYTEDYVDPLKCEYDKETGEYKLNKRHNEDCDWYSLDLMMFESYLFISPFGGVYKPKLKKDRIPPSARRNKGITVFHNDVIIPKNSEKFNILPDELLHHYQQTFTHKKRGKINKNLLESLDWKICSNCMCEYSRNNCPNCTHDPIGITKSTLQINKSATCETIFKTKGIILTTRIVNDTLQYLYHYHNEYKRENGITVLTGELKPNTRYKIHDDLTVLGVNTVLYKFKNDKFQKQYIVDDVKNPTFDINVNGILHYCSTGQLYTENTQFNTSDIQGDVLLNQTLFWTGYNFNFGFYRAFEYTVGFIYNNTNKGIYDEVKLNSIKGKLLGANTYFYKDICILFIQTKNQNVSNEIYLINNHGDVLFYEKTKYGDHQWLNKVTGKVLYKNYLFSSTDEGIIRLDIIGNNINVSREYKDTQKFIDSNSRLHICNDDIIATDTRNVNKISIK